MSAVQAQLWSLEEAPPTIEFTDAEVVKLRYLVMEDAARTYVDGRCGRAAFEEAAAWVEDNTIAPFSFRVCCTELGVDFEVMREHLHDLARRRQFRQQQPKRRKRELSRGLFDMERTNETRTGGRNTPYSSGEMVGGF